MIGSVGSGVNNLELFKNALTSGRSMQNFTEEQKSTTVEASPSTASPQKTAQYYAELYAARNNNNTSAELVEAIMGAANTTEAVAKGDALHQIERDTSYWDLKWRDGIKGMTTDIGLIESFNATTGDKTMQIYGCTDKSSTPENPVMYMETNVNGVVEAYLVELNKIDLTNATLIEAFALSTFTVTGGEDNQSTRLAGCWTDCMSANSGVNQYPDSYLNKINLYESVEKNFVGNWLSSADRTRVLGSLSYAENSGNSECGLIQYLALRDVVSETQILLDPNNRRNPTVNLWEGVQCLETALWGQGIDWVYPDGSTYSQHLYGMVDGN